MHKKVSIRVGSGLTSLAMVLTLLPATALAREDADGAAVQIGTATYATLEEAFTAAQSGDTVEVLRDTSLLEQVIIRDKTIILDCNGHEISYTGDADHTNTVIDLNGAADVTITGNGSFTFDKAYEQYNSLGYTLRLNDSSKLTVEDGDYYSGLTCIQAGGSASARIEGGTFRAASDWNQTYWLLNLIDNSDAKIEVSGGTFENYDPANSKTENPVANFCAEGYLTTSRDLEGKTYYTVEPAPVKVGDTWYATLPEAVAAADSGATINLLADVDLTACLELGKSVTIQGNGHTITNTANRIVRLTQSEQPLDVQFYNCNLISRCTASSDVRGISVDNDVAPGTSLLLDGCTLSASFYALNILPGVSQLKVTIRNGSVAAGWAAINSYSQDSSFTIEHSRLTGVNDKGESKWNNFATIVFDGWGFSTHDNIGRYGSNNTVQIVDSEIAASTQSGNAQDWLSLQYGATGNRVHVDGDSRILDGDGADMSRAVYVAKRTGTSTNPGQEYDPDHVIQVEQSNEAVLLWAPAGKSVTLPEAPSKAGYQFDGWWDGKTLYNGGAAYTMGDSGSAELTSRWTAVSHSSGSTGSSTVTTTNPDGSTTTTVTRPDGSTTETTKAPNGTSSVVSTDKDGQMTAQVQIPETVVTDAAEKGETVKVPMPQVPVTTERENAPTVTVRLPANTAAKVEIPVENVTAGTVAILVKADGTEEIVKNTIATENGVELTLEAGATVKIVDNSRDFTDVADGYWAQDAVDFAVSRELFNGTGEQTFSPESAMSRAMIVTVLARYEGVETDGGDTWYESGAQWAVENGVSDGKDLETSVTREQLITMLYRYAGAPKTSGTLDGFADGSSVSAWAADAMAWAVENGLIGGVGEGMLNPTGTATRAQVAAILARFVAHTA